MKATFKTVSLATAISSIFHIQATQANDQHPVNTVLDEVVVTSKTVNDTHPVSGYNAKRSSTLTKTDTPLLDTPQSVSVITKDQINDQAIQSISDAVRYVPGVVISQGEGNRDALNFRGSGVTTGDFYLDGMRDDIQTYRDFYNTDRIEVLKGPNGMIFGRGAAGGAINRVTKEAGWTPVRELQASYGAYNQKRSSMDIGNPLNEHAAYRINAVYEDSGSYRSGVTLKRYGVNPTLTILPNDQTRISFGAEYFMDQRVGDRGIPSVSTGNGNLNNRPYLLDNTSTFYGSATLSPNETITKALTALIEHTFDNQLTLRNKTRYADYRKFYQNVYANSPVSNGLLALGAYRDATNRTNLINQTDLIYTFKTGNIEHQLLAGLELATQDTDNTRLTATAKTSENLGDFALGTAPASLNFYNMTRNQESTVDTVAVYVQDQIKLTEQWQAVLGLRHDQFKTNYQDMVAKQAFNVTDNFISPRAGLIYKPLSNLSFYTAYSLSYVPRAGDQLLSLTATNRNFQPEKFINQEIGAKWEVTPELSLTAAAYKLERQNVAITNPSNVAQTILVDGQETLGLELGASGKINSQWQIVGGYAYQEGEITQQQGSGTSAILKGATLGQTPTHNASLWNRYNINDQWGVGVGIVTRSAMYALTPTATQSTILSGYTRYDAAVFWKPLKDLQLQLNLENITDKSYALSAHNNNNILPGSPLTARVTLIYQPQ